VAASAVCGSVASCGIVVERGKCSFLVCDLFVEIIGPDLSNSEFQNSVTESESEELKGEPELGMVSLIR